MRGTTISIAARTSPVSACSLSGVIRACLAVSDGRPYTRSRRPGEHVMYAEASVLAAILLNAGARTSVRHELLNSTPLGWACRWGRAEVVRLLLEHGTDPFEPRVSI
jgi:hypothetical protein